jgi:type II secretory pathway pseudopilin PulG
VPAKKSRKGCWIAALAGAAVLVLLIAVLAAAVYFLVLPKLKRGAQNATEGMKAMSEEAKQAKAMADLQLFAATLQAYQSDVGHLPSPGHTPDSYYSIVDLSALSGMLCPKYFPSIPKDPWGNPYLYGISYDDRGYVLICTGSDGVNGLRKIPDSPLETSCFEDEMVVEDGTVLQKPGGPQKHCEEAGGQR